MNIEEIDEEGKGESEFLEFGRSIGKVMKRKLGRQHTLRIDVLYKTVLRMMRRYYKKLLGRTRLTEANLCQLLKILVENEFSYLDDQAMQNIIIMLGCSINYEMF